MVTIRQYVIKNIDQTIRDIKKIERVVDLL